MKIYIYNYKRNLKEKNGKSMSRVSLFSICVIYNAYKLYFKFSMGSRNCLN